MVTPVTDSFDNDFLAEFLEDEKNLQGGNRSYFCKHQHKFILDALSNGRKYTKELSLKNSNSFLPLSEKENEYASNEIT